MKNILVTGATGFIGYSLVEALFNKGGYTVFCLVRSRHKARRLSPFGVKLLYADITDKNLLKAVNGYKIDVVFHCAGYVANKYPGMLHRVNVAGTENVCDLSCALGVERMIYLSSVAVVSGNSEVPLKEELPYHATNIYGESKIEAEKRVLEYRKKGLKVVIFRPPMLYGEGEPHLLKYLLTLLRYGLLPVIDGGKNKLHLGYVKNVVEAMIYSLGREDFLKGSFFVADKEILTQREVFSVLSNAAGFSSPWNIPPWMKPLLLKVPGIRRKLGFFLKDRVYSIEKIRATGFIPPYSAIESLAQSARSFKNQGRKIVQ